MSPVTFERPGFLVLGVVALACWLAWRRWPPPVAPRRRRFSLGVRLALVVLLVLALAGARVARHPDRRAVVAVVDLSDSTRGGEDAGAVVRALARAKDPGDLFGVVTFGRDAQVEISPTTRPRFEDFQTRPDGGYSDIAGALRLAANLVPSGYGRQLVLVSDGRQNLGDAAGAVAGLRSEGVRVDVLAAGAPPRAEALVLELDVPHELRAGQSLTATARLRATEAVRGQLTFAVDGSDVEARQVDLPAGASSQAFPVPPLSPGVHRLRATLDAQPDAYWQNNVAEAVVRVAGPPAVLVLEGSAGEATNVVAALGAAGMQVETRRGAEAPADAAALARYDSVVVHDAPARDFNERSLAAMSSAVRDLGRGLVAIGGQEAYGSGGWGGTPLEDALPVRMEVDNTRKITEVAVVFVIETMEHEFGDVVARTAIQGIVDQLTPRDEVGFVAMDATSRLVVPLSPASDKASVVERIGEAELGDPRGYGDGLQMAFDALAPSRASRKHVVLIGDGDATADRDRYGDLIARAQRDAVTLSAIGVDTHGAGAIPRTGDEDPRTFMEHMEDLARLGGGAFFLSRTASDLPQLLLKESRLSLGPWIQQGPFFPKVSSAGDLLAGVHLDAFPQLDGYVATTPKASAEVALTTPKADPLLAGWQYGLGRSVAWTSDAGGRWTAGFLRSPVAAALFARMVAWSMPLGGGEPLKLEASPSGDGLDVAVTAPEGGDVRMRVLAPDLTSTSQELAATAPGRWRASVPTAQVGTYVLHAVLGRGGADAGQGEIAVAVPYSPEYLEVGRDEGLLRLLAGRGGRLLARPATAWSLPVSPEAVTSDVFWAFLLLVAVLWPIDVAVRRLGVTPRQLLSVVGSLVRRRRPAEVEVVLPASLARVRDHIGAHRRRVADASDREDGDDGARPEEPGGDPALRGRGPG